MITLVGIQTVCQSGSYTILHMYTMKFNVHQKRIVLHPKPMNRPFDFGASSDEVYTCAIKYPKHGIHLISVVIDFIKGTQFGLKYLSLYQLSLI